MNEYALMAIVLSLMYLGIKCMGVFPDRRKRAKIYLHKPHARLGILLCTQPVTAHVLSGDNSVRKVGIKHATLVSHLLVLDTPTALLTLTLSLMQTFIS